MYACVSLKFIPGLDAWILAIKRIGPMCASERAVTLRDCFLHPQTALCDAPHAQAWLALRRNVASQHFRRILMSFRYLP